MRTDNRRPGKTRAFTLIEVLVVIGVVALLAAILLLVLATARERGRRTVCLSNVRQIDAAMLMYVQDADGFFPPTQDDDDSPDWDEALLPYAQSAAVFRCPDCVIPPALLSDSGTPRYTANGYAFNYELSGADIGPHAATSEITVPYPSTTVAFCEVSDRRMPVKNEPGKAVFVRAINTNAPDTGEGLSPGETIIGPPGAVRHQGGSNYGFVDGHVRWYRPDDVSGADEDVDGKRILNTGTAPTFAR